MSGEGLLVGHFFDFYGEISGKKAISVAIRYFALICVICVRSFR